MHKSQSCYLVQKKCWLSLLPNVSLTLYKCFLNSFISALQLSLQFKYTLQCFSMYYIEMWASHSEIMWFYASLQLYAGQSFEIQITWVGPLTSNNVIHLLQGSFQHVAGIQRHGNTQSYKEAGDPHSVVWLEWLRLRDVQQYDRMLQTAPLPRCTFRSFCSKQLSDFQVNNLLNVASGFKRSSHFVTKALPIVSAVIHKKPKLIFRIVCRCFVVIVCLCVFLLSKRYLWIVLIGCLKKCKIDFF